jgi:hypothetical protein
MAWSKTVSKEYVNFDFNGIIHNIVFSENNSIKGISFEFFRSAPAIKINNFLEDCKKKHIPLENDGKKYIHTWKENSKDSINLIKHLFIIDKTLKAEMLINLCTDLEISYIEVGNLNLKNPLESISFAKRALNKGYNDLIWELLLLYYKDSSPQDINQAKLEYDINMQTIYELADFIPSSHQHYADAQAICTDILLRMHPQPRKSIDLQKLFAHALNGNKQELTDKVFSLLCGHKQVNIKNDAETLLKVAKVIKKSSPSPRFYKDTIPEYKPNDESIPSHINAFI